MPEAIVRTGNGERVEMRILITVLVYWLALVNFGPAQAIRDDLTTWTLEYGVSGGLAPIDLRLKLAQTGDLTISTFVSQVSGHASADLLDKISGFLKSAKKAHPSTPGPDQRNESLVVNTSGVKLELEVPDRIGTLLLQTIDATLKNAFVGTWRESEWKLCHPAEQLMAEQMDPPIESLVFQNNGRFSVTWRGGGARAYADPSGKTPHVSIPDYSGRYTVFPDYSRIHMSFENGIYTPRDFSGDGNFQIDNETLTLKNLWLGMFKAPQRPDICDMTFKRSH